MASPTVFGPKIADPSTTRPIYLVVVEDPTVKGKIQYYKVQNPQEVGAFLELRGYLISKENADKLTENPHATINAEAEVNRKLPLHKIIRMDNLSYKSKTEPQGE
jgi:hypothetical protein